MHIVYIIFWYEIFNKYFKYQNPAFLLKDLLNNNRTKNEKIVNHVNNVLIDLKNAVNRKEIPKNRKPNKVIDIVEGILKFNKQQKWRGLPLVLACVAKSQNIKS